MGEQVQFACRYTDPAKEMKDTELAALAGVGIAFVNVWEKGYPTEEGYAKGFFTRDNGLSQGKAAYKVALELGQPDGRPIYFAIDFDAYTGAHRAAVMSYVGGLADGLAAAAAAGSDGAPTYPLGLYGGAVVLEWVESAGLASWFWQAMAPGWKNNKDDYPSAHLRTVGRNDNLLGVVVDRVHAFQDDYGGWDPVVS